jgi:uncharacterized alpha/beta hydrolase family protein
VHLAGSRCQVAPPAPPPHDIYEEKRDIQDNWSVLKSLVANLTKKHKAAMDAIICYTRGLEAFIEYTICASETRVSPVFRKYIGILSEFGPRCANYIYLGTSYKEVEL